MTHIIYQVKVRTSWKSRVNYNDGKFDALEVVCSFRSNLEDNISEGFLSLAIF